VAPARRVTPKSTPETIERDKLLEEAKQLNIINPEKLPPEKLKDAIQKAKEKKATTTTPPAAEPAPAPAEPVADTLVSTQKLDRLIKRANDLNIKNPEQKSIDVLKKEIEKKEKQIEEEFKKQKEGPNPPQGTMG
jgi:hypothetical protein